ncbi:MAG: TfoX/Sxy family protein [Schleiferiaceae bacterium]|jgi:TfoX/Sxy family transcriptional regulator of competence genes|nr:TfoX/Sxy family protein [Schleiferiaceae bacterium]
MAFDEYLGERIAQNLNQRKVLFEEKKMFGGLAFMINGKMCVGIVKNEMMARIGPDAMDEALKMEGCRIMDFTGRPMKGYVFISQDGIDSEENLNYFIELALKFNTELTS